MGKKISKSEVQKQLNTLSMGELLDMLDVYSKETGEDISIAKKKLITNDLQSRLLSNKINTNCPYCKSSLIIKKGTRANGIKEFMCKDCNKKFTLFTNTILEKTQYHWDIWIKVVEMVLNHYSIEHMKEVLVKDYGLNDLNYKTVFLWKHKIINALANMPMPKLNGIIQIDETFFRETQKGSRNLESTIKDEERLPRYGRRASKYGVMGNEFANVVCMVDLNGYVVAKVIGLGKLTKETFTSIFDDYIENPIYLCSDGNSVYKNYCEVKGIPLYIKPSNYVHTIKNAGIVQLDPTSPTYKKDYEKQQKIYEKLYDEKLIDYMYNMDISYEDFYHLKNANSLSLARVNQFHSELKEYLVQKTKGVSTKYLQDYIGFYTFVRNWRVANGHYPSSNKDAQAIFVDILKGKTTYTIRDLENAKLDLPKVSDKYMQLLKEKTLEMRKLTKNPFFKYDEEDNVVSFDKRKFLEEIPVYKLNKLCSKYRIKQSWAKYSKISELIKKPNIDDDILLLINEGRHYDISEEDLEVIKSSKYVH